MRGLVSFWSLMIVVVVNRCDCGVVYCEVLIGNGGGEFMCFVLMMMMRFVKIVVVGWCGCCYGCVCVKWFDYFRLCCLGWKFSVCL